MVVVRDEDDVDRRQVVRGDGRAGELAQDDGRARPRVLAGRIEGRVGQDLEAAVGDQRGRAADQADGRGGGFGHALIDTMTRGRAKRRPPGVARARWPIRSSKPAGRGSPTVGRFDSCAAPLTNHLQIPRFGTASLSILSVSPERLRVRRVRGVATGRPPGGESVCPRQDWRGCTLERCCRLPRPWASPGRNRTRPSIAGTVSVRQRQVHRQALRGRVARCVSIAASTSWRRRAGASALARAGRG